MDKTVLNATTYPICTLWIYANGSWRRVTVNLGQMWRKFDDCCYCNQMLTYGIEGTIDSNRRSCDNFLTSLSGDRLALQDQSKALADP